MTVLDGSNAARQLTAVGGWATLSDDRLYRYELGRRWDLSAGLAVWVMLNPSTADGTIDDQTIRRCIHYSHADGCGGLVVVNLYAWRSTDRAALANVVDPVGPLNAAHLARWLGPGADSDVWTRIVAFGAQPFTNCMRWARIAAANDVKFVRSLGANRDGTPRHPARLGNAVKLVPWINSVDADGMTR